jgi:AraC-like DNA-binding protein
VLAACSRELLEKLSGAPEPADLHALWTAICEVTGESGLGVRMAEQVLQSGTGIAGRLAASSSTLGEGLLHNLGLWRASQRTAQVTLYTDGATASVAVEPIHASPMHPEAIGFVLAFGVLGARSLTQGAFCPSEICFEHDPPCDLRHHERVFRAPLRFRAFRNACYFDSELLQLSLRSADRELNQRLVAQVKARLARAPSGLELASRVRAMIEQQLGRGDASFPRVAATLGLSPRTFSRRLDEHGLSFRELLKSVRYESAKRLLRRSEMRVGSVALLLGYSEKSSFNRAFREWSGCSPAEFRARAS